MVQVALVSTVGDAPAVVHGRYPANGIITRSVGGSYCDVLYNCAGPGEAEETDIICLWKIRSVDMKPGDVLAVSIEGPGEGEVMISDGIEAVPSGPVLCFIGIDIVHENIMGSSVGSDILKLCQCCDLVGGLYSPISPRKSGSISYWK